MDRTLISLCVHIIVVTAWVGSVMLDVVATATPGLPLMQRARLLLWSRPLVILLIGAILITGIWQTVDNPVSAEMVTSYAKLEKLREKDYGFALFIKHIFVLVTFVLTLLVRFVLAPRLRDRGGDGTIVATGGGAAIATVDTAAVRPVLWASVLNLAACVLVLIFTMRMVYTLH